MSYSDEEDRDDAALDVAPDVDLPDDDGPEAASPSEPRFPRLSNDPDRVESNYERIINYAERVDRHNTVQDLRRRQRERNDAARQHKAATGARYQKDANGFLQPVIDPATGKQRHTPGKSAVNYDSQGRPYQAKTDEAGRRDVVNPDADAKYGENAEDPEDPNIYLQTDATAWKAFDPEKEIMSGERKLATASARALRRREMARVLDEKFDVDTQLNDPTRPKQLTKGERQSAVAMRDGLAASEASKPEPVKNFWGGGINAEKTAAAEAEWMAAETDRKARLADAQKLLDDDDERLALWQKSKELNQKHKELNHIGVAGYLKRRRDEAAQSLVNMPEEEADVAVGQGVADIEALDADLAARGEDLTQRQAALEAEASRGYTMDKIAEMDRRRAELAADAEAYNADVARRGLLAEQLKTGVEAREARQKAERKAQIEKQRQPLRENPATAKFAQELDALDAEAEQRIEAVRAMPEGDDKTAAAKALHEDLTAKQGKVIEAMNAEARARQERFNKTQAVMFAGRELETEKRKSERKHGKDALDEVSIGMDGMLDPLAVERASINKYADTKAETDRLAQKRDEGVAKLLEGESPENAERIKAEAKGWNDVMTGKADVAVVQGMPVFSPELQDDKAKATIAIGKLKDEGKLTEADAQQALEAYDRTEEAVRQSKMDFFKEQPAYAEAKKKNPNASDDELLDDYAKSRTGPVNFIWDVVKGWGEGGAEFVGMELDGNKLRGMLSEKDDSRRKELAFSLLQGVIDRQAKHRDPFTNDTAATIGQTTGQLVAQIGQQMTVDVATRSVFAAVGFLIARGDPRGGAIGWKAGSAIGPWVGTAASAYGNANVYGLDYFQSVVQDHLKAAGKKSIDELSPEQKSLMMKEATEAFHASQAISSTEMIEPEMFLKMPLKAKMRWTRRVLDAGINVGTELFQEVFTNIWKENYMRNASSRHEAQAAVDWGDIGAMAIGLLPVGGAKYIKDTRAARREARAAAGGTPKPNDPAINLKPTKPLPEAVAAAREQVNAWQPPEGLTSANAKLEQQAALSALKILEGAPLESLTSDERFALERKTLGGKKRMEIVDGKPVITNEQLRRLKRMAPAADTAAIGSEETVRQEIADEAARKKEEANKSPVVSISSADDAGQLVSKRFKKADDGNWVEQRDDGGKPDVVTPQDAGLYKTLEEKAAFARNPQKPDPVKHGEFGQTGYTAVVDSNGKPIAGEAAASLPPIPVGRAGSMVTPQERRAAKQIADTLAASGADKATAADYARYYVRREGTDQWTDDRMDDAVAEFEAAGGMQNPQAMRDAIKASRDSQKPEVDKIHEQVTKQWGEDYTSLPQEARQKADNVLRHRIIPELIRYRGAFQKVVGGIKALGGAGVGLGRGDGKGVTFNFNLPDLLKKANLDAWDGDVVAERTVNEEVAHSANTVALAQARVERTGETGDVLDMAMREAAEIWGWLPKAVQRHVHEIYGKKDAELSGMEFWRMLTQRDIAIADGKFVTADGKILTEQTDPGLLAKLKDVFRRLIRVFAKLETTLRDEFEAQGLAKEEVSKRLRHIRKIRAQSVEVFRGFQKSGDEARSAAYRQEYGKLQADRNTAPVSSTTAATDQGAGRGTGGDRRAHGKRRAGQAGGRLGQPAAAASSVQQTGVSDVLDEGEAAGQELKQARDKIDVLEAELTKRRAKEDRIKQRREQAAQKLAEAQASKEAILAKVPEAARALAAKVLEKVHMGMASYVLGANRERMPAVYVAAAPGTVQASHTGQTFEKNPLYGGENTRRYHQDEAEQGKVLAIAAQGALDEDAIVTDAKSAADGPPQVALVIFNDADGNPRISLQTAGGNGREQGINLAPVEDQERLAQAWFDRKGSFGLEGMPEGWLGYRFLGVHDIRTEAGAKAYQQLVDKLNPSQGVVQDAAARADIDAELNIPVERLLGVSLDLSPDAAQEFMAGLVRDAEKLGLDRNQVTGLANNPGQAQFYIQRLLVAAAFRSKALGEFFSSTQLGKGSTTVLGLVKAAVSTGLQLRAKGQDGVANAIGTALERIAEQIKKSSGNIRLSIKRVAEQVEMDENTATIQAVAEALGRKVEFLPQRKNGSIPVDSDGTLRGFEEFFADMARAIGHYSPEPDIFGTAPSIAETISMAIEAHFRKVAAAQGRPQPWQVQARSKGGAKIPRSQMPQIKASERGQLARWLGGRGVPFSIESVEAGSLQPTQAGTRQEKIAVARGRMHQRTRAVLVSADDWILDGHHQWEALKEDGKPVPVVRVGVARDGALDLLREFEALEDKGAGTLYETEEYQYQGKAQEDWRGSGDAEAGIVNPINPDLSPDEKVDALSRLSDENIPLVEKILSDLASGGLKLSGKWSKKLPERIQSKASRPSIRSEKPWHDIEHVRDGLRFKVALDHFHKLPAIASVLAKNGVEVIKLDAKKMFHPKEWGWRFVAFDLRMPNGQLVEFYAPVPEMDAKAVKGPNHHLFEKWRNANLLSLSQERRGELDADQEASNARYEHAFMMALKRMGYADLSAAEASWNRAVALAGSRSRSKNSMNSTAEGVSSFQEPSRSLRKPNAQTNASPISGETETLGNSTPVSGFTDTKGDFSVEDSLDSDALIKSPYAGRGGAVNGKVGATPRQIQARSAESASRPRRIRELQKKQQSEGLTRWETDELAGLERAEGQNFFNFFEEVREDRFELESLSPAPEITRALAAQGRFDFGNATLVAPAQIQARAFHATPHEVDKFSLSKIGTGEGAQVYGWGLYFAEVRKVSLAYQRSRHIALEGIAVNSQSANEWVSDKDASDWLPVLVGVAELGGVDKYIQREKLRQASAGNLRRVNSIQENIDLAEQLQRDGVSVRKVKRGDIPGDLGNLYTVELDIEPDDLLDWDKPLSDQSEKIQKSFGYMRKKLTDRIEARRKEDSFDMGSRGLRPTEYEALETKAGSGWYGNLAEFLGSPQKASEYLQDIGIPGIRYLDGNSRDGGSGTHNYVIFDESKIRITHKNGEAVTLDAVMPPAQIQARGARDSGHEFFDFENPLTQPVQKRSAIKEGKKHDDQGREKIHAERADARRAQQREAEPGMGDLFQFVARQRQAERDSRQTAAGEQGELFDLDGRAGDRPVLPDEGEGRPDGGDRGAAESLSDVGERAPGEPGDAGRGDRKGRGTKPAGERTGSKNSGPALVQRPAKGSPERNLSISRDEALSPRGMVSKARANVAAIRLLRTLEAGGRNATAEEKAELVKFSGWGAMPQIFDDAKAQDIARGEIETRRDTAERARREARARPYSADYYTAEAENQEKAAQELENWKSQWGALHDEVRELLSDQEYKDAKRSVINAHYTSPRIIAGMWDIVGQLGFRGGNVLEPGMGIGHFFGLIPEEMADRSKLFGVELDSLSSRIARMLYPEADIQHSGFQTADIADNSMDLAISNVPFANVPVVDRALEAMGGPVENLHDYFFGKALTKLKPGGVMAFITSAFTMDKGNQEIRKWLSERADLIAAYRLPNDAFQENAGTQVVTDIIILRKKTGQPIPHAEEWANLGDATTRKGETIRINGYYARHPGNILGLLDNDGSMFAGRDGDSKEMTVHGDPSRPPHIALQQALATLPENIFGASADSVAGRTYASQVKMGNVVLGADGKYYFQGQEESDPKLNDPKNKQRVREFITLRNALNRQYDLELAEKSTDEDVEINRRTLNILYDTFRAKHGQIHDKANKIFIDDPDYFRLAGAEVEEARDSGIKASALELAKRVRGKVNYVKADVFSRRVLSPRVEPTTAKTLDDAFGISLGWRGRADTDFMASLLGEDVAKVEKQLLAQEIAVRDPETGQIFTREQYLSGNVRRKLEIAKAAGPEYARNVQMLEAVQPADVGIGDIRVQIGSTWVPPEVYSAFLNSLGVQGVKFSYHTNKDGSANDYWEADSKRSMRRGVAYKDFETSRVDVVTIMDALLNFKRITITEKDTRTDKPVVDMASTTVAREKAKALNERFAKWAQEDATVARRLEEVYNREVNAFTQRTYDGQFLSLPWLSKGFDIYPDKKNTIWRAIQEGFGLIAHGVGGGKTIIGTAVALEMRRLGMARKPMIVVHNSTLEGFAKEIARIAPTARVLVGRKDELQGDKRREFLMRIAAGDWDAVVIAHSTFNLIEDDPRVEVEHMESLIDEMSDSLRSKGYKSLEDAKEDRRKSPSVKNLVKQIERLEASIRKASERRTDTGLLNFQQLGVDSLIVDEVHEFKKMPFSTKIDAKGIDGSFSKRGYSLLMRARNIQERMGGKNVFTMTGTPVTNTLGEVWNMVRLVAPQLIKEYGITHFDQFVSKFAEVETASEMGPTGEYKNVERLSKVINLPEWATFLRMAADVKLGEDLVVKNRPGIKGGRPELVSIPRSPGVAKWVEYIRGTLEAYADMDHRVRMENPRLSAVPVQAFMASRAAAIDIRLVEPRAKDDLGSKVNVMLERAMGIYHATEDYKGTQAIFADSFNSQKIDLFQEVGAGMELDIEVDPASTAEGFNLYEDIRRKLIARGVPETEIAVITDSKWNNDKRKQALFELVNKGEVRFVIGSSKKLGTGVNMQRLMAAAHHLDVPWTPAELEQRDGRVFRQGNIHGEMGADIELVRYGMKDTLDSALWQKLETKQRFITAALSGKIVGRELEESDEIMTLAEQRAVLSGPWGQKIFELETRLKELQRSRAGFQAEAESRQNEIRTAKLYLGNMEKANERLEPSLQKMEALGQNISANEARIAVDGKTFDTKAKMAEAVNKALDESRKAGEDALPVTSITVNGVPVFLQPNPRTVFAEDGEKTVVEFELLSSPQDAQEEVFFGRVSSAATLLSRLEELFGSVADIRRSRENNVSRLRQLASMEEAAQWPHEQEYQEVAKEIAEIKTKKGRQIQARSKEFPTTVNETGEQMLLDFDAIPSDPEAARADGEKYAAKRFQENLPLAMHIAAKFFNIPGADAKEIRQQARLALADAARNFDPARGKPFAGMAGVYVRNRLRGLYRQEVQHASRFPVSLDEPLEPGETATHGDYAEDMRTPSAVDETARRETLRMLDEGIARLPKPMQKAVHGFYEGRGLEDIGRELGNVSRQRVAVLQKEAFRRLRGILGEQGVSSPRQVLARGKGDDKTSTMPDADRTGQPAQPASTETSQEAEKGVARGGVLPHAYRNGNDSLKKADERFGGAQGVLRGASRQLGETVAYLSGKNSPKSGNDEIRALTRFARSAGLMIDAGKVRAYMAENAMRGGSEHSVAHAIPDRRVLKDLNAHAIGTESLFDYLTDLELSNHFFGDDIRLEGFYGFEGKLHIITSQPLIDGPHPRLPDLKNALEAMGLVSESPTGSTGAFVIHDTKAGDIFVIDAKPDNAILDESGDVIPVDFHFYFDNHEDRKSALNRLGLHPESREPGNGSQQVLSRAAENPEGDPIDNLLRDLDAEMDNWYETALAEEAAGEGLKTGRPDLAHGAANAEVRAVDAFYTDKFVPETEEAWEKEAHDMVQRDFEGTRKAIQEAGLAGQILTPQQIKAADIIALELRRRMLKSGTAADRTAFNVFWYSRRAAGSAWGRAGRAMRDPFKSPVERAREFLLDYMTKPGRKAQKQIDRAPSEAALAAKIKELEAKLAEAQRQGEQDRARRLAAEMELEKGRKTKERLIDEETAALLEKLKAAGITPQDVMQERVALSLMDKNILKGYRDRLRKMVSARAAADLHEDAFNMILKNHSFAEIAKRTGLSEAVVRKIKADFVAAMRAEHFAKFATGAKADAPSLITGRKVEAQAAEQEFAKWLKKLGIVQDEAQGRRKFSVDDPAHVARMMRAIQATRGEATWVDMAYEWWIMNILSGPQTQIVNITGNLGSAALDMTLQRGMEMMFNVLVRDAKSAQLGEFRHLMAGLRPGLAKGLRMAIKAWSAEHDFFESTVLGTPLELKGMDKLGGTRASIPGKFGRVVRTSGRALLFMDSMFKTALGQMEAGAQAYRIAKAEGLTGKALERRIAQLSKTRGEILTEYQGKVKPTREAAEYFARALARRDATLDADELLEDRTSEAWERAHEQLAYDAAKKAGWSDEAWQAAVKKARELTFQQDLLTKKQGGNTVEDAVAKLQDARTGNKLLGYLFPFVKTPYNIFRVGFRKSPLGSLNLAMQATKGLYGMKDGMPYLEAHPQLVRDLAEQAIAWTAFAFLFGAAEGDDDDDDKLILFTGSEPRKQSWGVRDLNARNTGGSYVVRIGGRNGIYINYGRLEPFATVLGTTVDIIRGIKRRGTSAENVAQVWDYIAATVDRQPFLEGAANLVSLFDGRDNLPGQLKREALQAIVPNIVRQPLRNLDDYARDSRTAGMGYQMFPVGALAEKKVNPYGEEIRKGSNPIARLFFPAALQANATVSDTDRALLNWNRNNPGKKAWAPQQPDSTYKNRQGQAVQMTAAEAHRYRTIAGRRAVAKLRGIVTPMVKKNPSEKDVEDIRRAFIDARREAREIVFGAK